MPTLTNFANLVCAIGRGHNFFSVTQIYRPRAHIHIFLSELYAIFSRHVSKCFKLLRIARMWSGKIYS